MSFFKKQLSKHKMAEGKTFLHGHLIIEIRAAKNLPDMEGWVSKLVDKGDVTDPFVDVRLGRAKLVKTSVVLNSLSPEWNESFR
jgi:Ca2+-dependent lipid-binding protein